MKKRLLKDISLIITPILILAIAMCIMLRNFPSKMYTKNEEAVIAMLPDFSPIGDVKYDNKKIQVNLLGVIPVKTIAVEKVNKDIEVIPGGNSVGVVLSSRGILVVGFSDIDGMTTPAKIAGLEVGDIITSINDQKVETSKELIEKIQNLNQEKIKLTLERDSKKITKEIQLVKSDNRYKLGLWIRDTTAGVGTLTFYDPETKKFGALGHGVTDGETNKCFEIKQGELLESSIVNVRKSEKGVPGELKGIFIDDKESIGKIDKNTQCGIFGNGNFNDTVTCNKQMPVGFRDEIETGKATILTTLDETGPKEYSIEIIKLFNQDSPNPKSMLIKVTDPELLKKTGGIVQGMSGSPIIQNGKIIGAVTHVLINKPDVGYGIYIDWMLEDAGLLK